MRPFRFGILHMSPVHDGARFRSSAQRVEELGYDVLLLSDHFQRSPVAPIPALMAAAAATSTIRVGTLVLANDFRRPAVLAKELGTLDVLTDGRLEVGIGAGWMSEDYTQGGIVLDDAGRRIDRLIEALDIIEPALARQVANGGATYPVEGLVPVPVPVQSPRPPLLIGGGGRRMLTLAATRADIVSVNWRMSGGTFDSAAVESGDTVHTDAQLGWIRSAAGDRMADLELHLQVYLAAVTDDSEAVVATWRRERRFDIPVAALAASPHVLVGSVEEIVAKVQSQRKRWGFSYLSFYDASAEDMAPVVEALSGR